ncbi:hypothetical protein QUB70_01355 [Microcoleus sp. A003_D6]|uniref:hypothetical protein n=1 Tax=Microcoleus sp. A003_D6 TaxID=3055266 RepID=UPI002FD2F3CB
MEIKWIVAGPVEGRRHGESSATDCVTDVTDVTDLTDVRKKEEGSSATDVTDVRKKEKGRRKRDFFV